MKPEDVRTAQLLVDTDVFSYIAAGKYRHADFEPFLTHRVPALSFASVAELLYLAEKAGWGKTRRSELELKIAGHLIIYPDMRVSQKWAELSRAFRGQSACQAHRCLFREPFSCSGRRCSTSVR